MANVFGDKADYLYIKVFFLQIHQKRAHNSLPNITIDLLLTSFYNP